MYQFLPWDLANVNKIQTHVCSLSFHNSMKQIKTEHMLEFDIFFYISFDSPLVLRVELKVKRPGTSIN